MYSRACHTTAPSNSNNPIIQFTFVFCKWKLFVQVLASSCFLFVCSIVVHSCCVLVTIMANNVKIYNIYSVVDTVLNAVKNSWNAAVLMPSISSYTLDEWSPFLHVWGLKVSHIIAKEAVPVHVSAGCKDVMLTTNDDLRVLASMSSSWLVDGGRQRSWGDDACHSRRPFPLATTQYICAATFPMPGSWEGR